MLRRLFFVLPDTASTNQIVEELAGVGIPRQRLRTLAAPTRGGNGAAPGRQQSLADPISHLEQLYWIGLLVLFALALIGLLVALARGSVMGGAVALAIMAGSFLSGVLFAVRVPNTHLDEFRGALAHGEVLLAVDAPRDQVREIEERVTRQHPEAVVGGVGWTLETLRT